MKSVFEPLSPVTGILRTEMPNSVGYVIKRADGTIAYELVELAPPNLPDQVRFTKISPGEAGEPKVRVQTFPSFIH